MALNEKEIIRKKVKEVIEGYISRCDWRVHENSNTDYSFPNLMLHASGWVIAEYVLNEVYKNMPIAEMHRKGQVHIHDLSGGIAPYCAGWSLKQLLDEGFNGVPGKTASNPAKHLRSAISHIVNFLGVMSNEWMGAQAFSDVDVYLAPYILKDYIELVDSLKEDGLDLETAKKVAFKLVKKDLRQSIQELLFNLNFPTRWGGQAPFTNFTLALTIPEDLKDLPATVANKPLKYRPDIFKLENDEGKTFYTYQDLQEFVNLFNKTFFEVYLEGDANGRVFTFPVLTINLTNEFFDLPKDLLDVILEANAKYGATYFQNCINGESGLQKIRPSDVRSMCLEANEALLLKNNNKIYSIKFKDLDKILDLEFDNEGWADVNSQVYALSLNPATYKLEWSKIKRVLKLQSKSYTKIKTKDGKFFVSTQDHPVAVYTENRIVTKQAKDITKGDLLLVLKKASEALNNEYQKMTDGKVLDEKYAYVLGLFIAKGDFLKSSSEEYKDELVGLQFRFHKDEGEYIDKVKKFFKNVYNDDVEIQYSDSNDTVTCYIYSKNIAKTFYNSGFTKHGKLPQILFNSPKSVIEAFLKGFFDGNGYKVKKEINVNDKDLAKDLIILCSLAGIDTAYKERKNAQTIGIHHAFDEENEEEKVENEKMYDMYPKFVLRNNSKEEIWHSLEGLIPGNIVEKYNFVSDEYFKLKNGSFAVVEVEEVINSSSDTLDFYDIELDNNHYFVHSLGHITHNCCRLQLDLRELQKHTGGLFGNGEYVGSIGVITLNLPEIGYWARKKSSSMEERKKKFLEILEDWMEKAKDGLLRKREVILENFERGLYPYTKRYLVTKFKTHFLTIGYVGLHEAMKNLGYKEGLLDEDAHKFAQEVLDFMRNKTKEYQQKYGCLFNLEATPSEGASYRLARLSKKRIPDLIASGTEEVPYFTNSCHPPVWSQNDLVFLANHQNELQNRHTGGTVVHFYIGEKPDKETLLELLKLLGQTKIPYFTFTTVFSVCPVHGYIPGEHPVCPYPHTEEELEKFGVDIETLPEEIQKLVRKYD